MKDGLKLFEIETVLSLELRKPKKKLDPSSVSESVLTGFFATYGYDECPETSLPSQINNKVTVTESALKKKIQESKDGRFMEEDKRILEELKSLQSSVCSLDLSILAEEFLTSCETYEQEAKKHTEETAGSSLDDMEKKMVDPVTQFIPQHLICPLTKKMFVDPVKTLYGTVYERKALEEYLKQHQHDPLAGSGHELKLVTLQQTRT